MYVNRWFEKPFGSDEPHIGGYWDSELISEPNEIEEAFLDVWFWDVYVCSEITVQDDYGDDDIQLEAQHFFGRGFRVMLQECLEHWEDVELTRTRFDSLVAACEMQVVKLAKKKKLMSLSDK